MELSFHAGSSYPLGATIQEKGINFSLYSPREKPKLVFYTPQNWEKPIYEVDDLKEEKGTWFVTIENLPKNLLYGYKLPSQNFCLIDPYAKNIFSPEKWGERAKNAPYFRLAYLPQNKTFDWEKVLPPKTSEKNLIIYEMHLRGFTQDPSSRVKHPGTFLGMIEKIPYLKKLGVTAVELQPILEFDETKHPKNLVNFWGYSPVHFFSIMRRYAVEDPILELCQLVKELHKNQIKILLDVVYNHTGEDFSTPYHCKGFSPENYYILHQGKDTNYTGCGNTFSCNNPASIDLIVSSLRYFVETFHIDGFRFDLASIFFRGEKGEVLQDSPLLKKLQEDPIFKNTLFIAEPWDAAGLYQVGTFAKKYNWMEWNGIFRDQVRLFWHPKQKGDLKEVFSGTSSVYPNFTKSINFITCHDGFSLKDLTCFTQKHNEANNEENQDGNPHNLSYNFGVEGYTKNPEMKDLRIKQRKNFWLTLLFSKGIPLLLMGDEYFHSKEGNNNTWCQDNSLSWFNWEKEIPWMQKQIALRKTLHFLQDVAYSYKEVSGILFFQASVQKKSYLWIFNPKEEMGAISLDRNYSWKVLCSSSERDLLQENKVDSLSCLLLEGSSNF